MVVRSIGDSGRRLERLNDLARSPSQRQRWTSSPRLFTCQGRASSRRPRADQTLARQARPAVGQAAVKCNWINTVPMPAVWTDLLGAGRTRGVGRSPSSSRPVGAATARSRRDASSGERNGRGGPASRPRDRHRPQTHKFGAGPGSAGGADVTVALLQRLDCMRSLGLVPRPG